MIVTDKNALPADYPELPTNFLLTTTPNTVSISPDISMLPRLLWISCSWCTFCNLLGAHLLIVWLSNLSSVACIFSWFFSNNVQFSNRLSQPLPQGFPWGAKTANNTNACEFPFSILQIVQHRYKGWLFPRWWVLLYTLNADTIPDLDDNAEGEWFFAFGRTMVLQY